MTGGPERKADGGRQDKGAACERPKSLSAHRFWRHAFFNAYVADRANTMLELNIPRAVYSETRHNMTVGLESSHDGNRRHQRLDPLTSRDNTRPFLGRTGSS